RGQGSGEAGRGTHGARSPRLGPSSAPGTYPVTASANDTQGDPVSWTIIVRVFPRLRVSCRGRVTGGEGTILRTSRRRHSITVLDAAGGQATARTPCPAGGRTRRGSGGPAKRPRRRPRLRRARGFTG